MVQETTGHVSGLHAKLDRKKAVDQHNAQVHESFAEQMDKRFQRMQKSVEDYNIKNQGMQDFYICSIDTHLAALSSASNATTSAVSSSFATLSETVSRHVTQSAEEILKQEGLSSQVREDLQKRMLEAHGLDRLPHFDLHGGSASMSSEIWMNMAMEERMLANISAYINLERRLMEVIEEQAESLLHGERDLHGGLQNLLEQVTALRAQLESLGTSMGLIIESDEGIDEVDRNSVPMYERKVRGYHVLRDLSTWAVRSVRDVRKLQKEQQRLANKTETLTEGNGQ